MTPQEYLEFTRTTAARHTSGINVDDWATYVRLGLISEVGEVAGQVKRIIRDDGGVLTDERRGKLLDELGDVLWYWAQMLDAGGERVPGEWPRNCIEPKWYLDRCVEAVDELDASKGRIFWDEEVLIYVGVIATMLDSTLEDVAVRNVAKLSARVTAGTIHGEGGER